MSNFSKVEPVEESKDFQKVDSKKHKKIKMSDFKKSSSVTSPYQNLRNMIEENISDHDPVLHGPPFNPVIDLAKLSHDALVARAKGVMTEFNPTGLPPPGSAQGVPPMSELLDHIEDAKRDSYASMNNSFGDRQSASESVDSSVTELTEEAPTKKSRSYKDASRKSNAKVSFADTTQPHVRIQLTLLAQSDILMWRCFALILVANPRQLCRELESFRPTPPTYCFTYDASLWKVAAFLCGVSFALRSV
jgi:hypothetical protein